jgi:hypothetical protein
VEDVLNVDNAVRIVRDVVELVRGVSSICTGIRLLYAAICITVSSVRSPRSFL